VGGRSRVAAQMLNERGFRVVYNLAGGIKAWQGNIAVGDVDLGLELFSGRESAEETLIVAYGMEQGLRDFYLTTIAELQNPAVKKLFAQLADIEILHEDRIFALYLQTTATTISRQEFEGRIVVAAMEGGLTTEEYINRLQPNLEDVHEAVAIAMSIEAQALDLYQRAAQRSTTEQSRAVLTRIASEEQAHLNKLGELFETV
jgi:rubrerythrin